MKRFLFLILSILIECVALAQTNRAINIYSGGNHEMYLMTDVDSIIHDANNIKICVKDQKFEYSVNEVDSIVWSESSKKYYYQIKEEGLEGWNEGYMNGDGCFVVCRQEEDGGYFAYIGQKDSLDDGITLKFDGNMEIQSIFSSKGIMNVFAGDDNKKYAMYVLQDGIHIEELSPTVQETRKYGVHRISAGSALNTVCNWANNALTAGDFGNLLSNGSGYLSTFLGNLIPSFMGLPSYGSLGLSLGLSYLEKKYEDHFYDLLYDYMGTPMIWISDIDDSNAPNYKIQVSIEGLNTIGKPMTCSVHTGIAVRVNESNVNYDNCDYHLREHGTNSDEVYSADLKAERKKYYYLRPYAVVKVDGLGGQFPLTRQKYLWGGPKEPIITYGDVDKIHYDVNPTATTGECISVTDKSAVVKCSYSGAKEFECGVVVSTNEGTETITTSSTDGEREISISGLSPATTYDYWAYVYADGEIITGELRSFTTNLPDISGTWTCTEEYYRFTGAAPSYNTYSLTLNSDGSASCSEYESIVSGSWSFKGDGTVTVSIMVLATQTINSGVEWSGTVDDIKNPKKITGGKYNWNYNQNGYFRGDTHSIVMTK